MTIADTGIHMEGTVAMIYVATRSNAIIAKDKIRQLSIVSPFRAFQLICERSFV
jgi:hypothetical protein